MNDSDPGFGELRSGNLGVRLAVSEAEVDAVQALRYRVFYEEMGAHADAGTASSRRDRDDFDAVADHLIVVDHDRGEGPESVIGCYRLTRRHAAARLGRWYSAAEYDIAPIIAFDGEILECGRSCVDAAYRTRGSMQLLWGGIAAYIFKHKVGILFGCASLPGTDLDALADQLTYLASNHMAPEAIRPRALPERYVEMVRKDPASIDVKRTLIDLPPLVKGYLRLGGFVGDGAVLDHQFNTTDVAVLVKTDQVTDKYYKHFERKVGGRD
ncbi:GNAT family N-acetyltransferase [Roseomonas sp. JC162]|uniref:L-ornithine N(alpha)-acyltransferase n=1 Tax=Neoroseomonas marina TaxID=1232220 RepID=A0A848EH04_9PROT|nr:GNAT family N-acetyltransferase [Neoroseomonas marina]